MIDPPYAIVVDRLVKVYQSGTAVAGISFALPVGSITGLLGGNGAGKTTTIAMIMGLVAPTSGTVTVLGAEMPRHRYRVLHRMNFESPYVEMPMRLTVRQNLTVFARLYRVERGATVLLASHNMTEVERLCERVIIMKQGKIEDDDTPAALLALYGRTTLEEVFLDVARGRQNLEAAQ
jgi:ABC-type multidrug transport system ATPase subunit